MNERRLSRRAVLLAVLLAAASVRAQAPPETLTLADALARALARAPEIAAASQEVLAARAAEDESRSAFKPQALVTSTPGYAVGLPMAVAGRVPAIAGAEARMLLLDPERSGGLWDARARLSGREAALAASRADVAFRTLAVYARARQGEALAAAARRRAEALEAESRRTSALVREGRRTELDAERAALEAARARRTLLAAESDRELDRAELRLLVGGPEGATYVLVDDPALALPEPGPGPAAEAARRADPELAARRAEVESLRRSAELRARWFAPTLEASVSYARLGQGSNYGDFYLNFKNDAFAGGVSLAIPVFTGGAQPARAAESNARLARAEAALRLREDELSSASARAAAAAEQADLADGLARRGVAVAQEARRVADALEGEGRGEPGAAARAAVSLAEAEEDAAHAARDRAAARVRLLILRGEMPGMGGR
jgi:outer membrane protein TolC